MSTCFLKRFVPFLLTLIVGLGLGSLFQNEPTRSSFTVRRYVERSYPRTTTTLSTSRAPSETNSWTPLAILFEPSTHMTAEARKHQTYGVVQLLIEYGADGKARVLERITTLPDGLTEEAERVATQTQFRPETFNGQPVPATRIQAYYFDMGRQ
jgi:Gram-negative bacterial TonB protein C-terminal